MQRLVLMLVCFCALLSSAAVHAEDAGVALGPESHCTVTVEQGDTLAAIARRHGVSEAALRETDEALRSRPDFLRLGQRIDICEARQWQRRNQSSSARSSSARPSNIRPASHERSRRSCGRGGEIVQHTVASGETLDRIAERYGVGKRDVIAYNRSLKQNHTVRRGQTLEICVGDNSLRKSSLCEDKVLLFSHEVVPGEHLGQIAGRYGVRRQDIVRWNPSLRSNPDRLRVGQRLRVCPEIEPRERRKITYVVKSGDNFVGIAKRHNLTPRELQRYQQGKLADPRSLQIGQELYLWVDGDIVRGYGRRDTDTGVLTAGVELPSHRHYSIKWRTAAWGTAKTIRVIQSAIAAYKRRFPDGPAVHIGDISKRGGGKFPPHVSHQHGRDVDIGYVLKGPQAHDTRFRSANAGNLDVARTWQLLKAFIDTNEVTYIFVDYRLQELLYEYAKSRGVSENLLDELFQYPRGAGRAHGIIRHWKGHVNHFHVRFRK